jgi:uncharacterized protein (TIGR02996 family)
MTTIESLLAAVQDAPADATLRLVLADAYEEAGLDSVAEWLRLDVQLTLELDRWGFVCPDLLNQRGRKVQPAGVPTLHNAQVRERTGREPVSMMHRLGGRRRR